MNKRIKKKRYWRWHDFNFAIELEDDANGYRFAHKINLADIKRARFIIALDFRHFGEEDGGEDIYTEYVQISPNNWRMRINNNKEYCYYCRTYGCYGECELARSECSERYTTAEIFEQVAADFETHQADGTRYTGIFIFV